jgi:CIC family chloride channel protein
MPERTRNPSVLARLQYDLAERVARVRIPEHTFMVLVAVIIGVMGGFGAIFFRFAIRLFQGVFFSGWHYSLDHVLQLPWYHKLLAPAVGGLIIGPIVYRFAREARGHGVPEVMESIALRGGAIRPRTMFAKITASAICIGSGGSVGREGPIVQIGSALGSIFGQFMKVRGSRLRTLVACGTAAGIAGTFNAPVAGALFAMEVILSDFGISQFSPIVVSSVAATVVSRHFLGDFPAFVIPAYELKSMFEMIPFAILGVLSAFAALAFIILLYKTEDLFESLRVPGFVKPAIGGLVIGAIGIFFPHVFGVGYETISLALESQLAWYFLLLLVLLKLIATSVTIGSGGSGGIFAPSLFLGAMLGGVVGSVVHTLFPWATGSSGAYALVGMGAVAAGAMHAPITSILMIFELTNDYRIILPLMLACIISVLITSRLKRDSIYTLKLSRRGIDLFRGQEINVLRSMPVSKVMKKDYETIHANASFRQLLDLTVNSSHPSFFVVDHRDRLMGVISVHDVRRLIYESDELAPIVVAHDLMNPVRYSCKPTDTLDTVMVAFAQLKTDELPVVNGERDQRLIGIVSQSDVIDSYNLAVFKRDAIASMAGYMNSMSDFKRVRIANGQDLSEMEIPRAFVDNTLEKLALRRRYGVEVILIKQNFDPETKEWGNVMAPRADYRFKIGDTVLLMGMQDGIDELSRMD